MAADHDESPRAIAEKRFIVNSKLSRLAPLDPGKFTDEQAELTGGRGSARSELSIVRTLIQS
jgi:hypothetical protein